MSFYRLMYLWPKAFDHSVRPTRLSWETRLTYLKTFKLAWMQEYDEEERELKSWRRQKVNLSKNETDDPQMTAKISALTLEIEEKEKKLTKKYPSKGTVFLGGNPLTNSTTLGNRSDQPLKLKKAHFTQLHDKGN